MTSIIHRWRSGACDMGFWLFRRQDILTDSVIDLRPIYLPEPDSSVRFGEVFDFRITLHGKWREIGQISLRMGESAGIYYFGHIGYHIDPPYRGHHYAACACTLLSGMIRSAGKESVVITTDVDNAASRKTCLRLGCQQERIVDVPKALQEKWGLSERKVRYIWSL